MTNTPLIEPRIERVLKYAGMGLMIAVALAAEAAVLYLVLRSMDHTTLLAIAILALVLQTIAWPAGIMLGARIVEKPYHDVLQHYQAATSTATGMSTSNLNVPDDGSRLPRMLAMTETEAAALLQQLTATETPR